MNKLMKRGYDIFLLFFSMLIISGCGSGGGGGSSSGFLGDVGRGLSGSSSSLGSIAESSSFSTVVSPEPSTILLLTSGLIGMAIYAKARHKAKARK